MRSIKNNQPTTNQMKNAQTAVVELIGLLSQAIDILRNHDAEDDANYIETQMEETIKLIKSK
jgi:predicted lipoprotein